ncbi:CS domain-containing protein [Entamoeba marina]
MITPHFNLSQTEKYVVVHIKIPPYQQFGNEDVQIHDNTMVYHSNPYFLSLTFNNDIAKDGSEKAEIDRLECRLRVYLPKANEGEVFPDLDMLPLFLTKKKVLHKVEVLDTQVNDDYKPTDTVLEQTNEQHLDFDIPNITEQHEKLDFPSKNTLIIGEDQVIRDDVEEKPNLFQPQYGFNNSHSDFFKDLQQSSFEIVMLRNPDTTDESVRYRQRVDDENTSFDKDHYICDTFEWEGEEDVLNNQQYWWRQENDWTNEEREEITQIPKLEVLVEASEETQLYKDLFGIIFAYIYDQIIMGETNVESAWSIATLSPVLSYFERIGDVKELMKVCVRRSLIYPMVRNYDLSLKVLQETIEVFKGRRVNLLKMLLRIRRIFKLDELKHYMCYLYFDEYCIWIQNAPDVVRYRLVDGFTMYLEEITKDTINLPLRESEQEYIDFIQSNYNPEDIDDETNEQFNTEHDNQNFKRGYLDE